MNYKNIARIFFVLTGLTIYFCQPSLAEDPHFLSAYQSEYGLKLYHDGKVDFAVERFTKALLLDPENKTAKESLQKISDELTANSDPRALKIARFIDQIEYFDFLDLRYRSLTEENARLLDFVHNNVLKDPTLSQKVQTIQTRQSDRTVITPNVGIMGFATDDQKSGDLDGIIASIGDERQLLLKEISFWEEQNNDLRTVRRSILGQGPVETAATVSHKYQTQLAEIQNRVSQKDNLLETQNQNIEYFKTQLSSVRDNFNTLQEKFKVTDTKIVDLTKKIADMSMDLLEKNKIITDKENYAANLQKEVSEANEKMSLVQRIIQEKDDRIASLEKEMAQVNVAVNSSATPSDGQVAQFQTDLKSFKEQFKSQMDKSRERIVGLEIQFTDLTQKYEALAADIQSKDSQIASLKGDVQKKTNAVHQYREAFLATNQKANELIGVVDIYRDKLVETKKILVAKEEELQLLQNQATKKESLSSENSKSNSKSNPVNELDLSFSKQTHPMSVDEGR